MQVLCKDGNVVLIDIETVGDKFPHIFRCLLGKPIQKSEFSYVPETNEKGQLTFCIHYDVSQKNLLQYLIYLKTGYISGDFDTLVHTAIKFGGCSALDEECERRAEMQREREHAYNPQSPKDDYLMVFQWEKDLNSDRNLTEEGWTWISNSYGNSSIYRKRKVDNEKKEEKGKS